MLQKIGSIAQVPKVTDRIWWENRWWRQS